MTDRLLVYYERELMTLRRLSRHYAQQHPAVAGQLELSGDGTADPHVERLIESVALLAGRLHGRIDDQYGEVLEGLAAQLFPHFTQPVPSRLIAQLVPAADGRGGCLPRHSMVEARPLTGSKLMEGFTCRFRTAYPLELSPVAVRTSVVRRAAAYGMPLPGDANLILRLELQAPPGRSLREFALDGMRLFIDADPQIAGRLYDLLLAADGQVRLAGGPQPQGVPAPGISIQPVGFDGDDMAFATDPRIHAAHGLLFEYFLFPDRFRFIDLKGLPIPAAEESSLDLLIPLREGRGEEWCDRLCRMVEVGTLAPNCVPLVNLFSRRAEPVRLDPARPTYPVAPDLRRPWAYQVHAIQDVKRLKQQGAVTEEEILPLHGDHHARKQAPPVKRRTYWVAAPATGPDMESGIEIQLVEPGRQAESQIGDMLAIGILCSNGDLPSRLSLGSDSDFTGSGGAGIRLRALRRPLPLVPAPITPLGDRQRGWRLTAHLGLNRSSLLEGAGEALRQMLRLYNIHDPTAQPHARGEIDRQINAIRMVESEAVVDLLPFRGRQVACRGTHIRITLDEQAFPGESASIFAHVLSRFLALYAGANSHVRLTIQSSQREGALLTWPSRPGMMPAL
ncbi:type VI secretion system baseplate subunit TssF [Niveispirillum irakense]|uniref:type VI secretion system baseplate subunit TssF n=1 Tax=Niveispirillum irakense TaxID=34011 RepID=UPI0003FCD650|nr:type VI secretion system baseplate subunit TssF [Niveispirillum irakense]